ncbi:MAG: flippase-like domain-containing protein [Oscillospiraceae bacterium]|nr:flippase-like domain-containing protein [Oscillospiraceae bacterium]
MQESKTSSGSNHKAASDFASSDETNKKKNKRGKYLLSGAFLVVLIALTFYVIFKDTSIKEIWGLLKNVRMSFVYAGILAMLGFILFQGLVIGLSAQCLKTRLTPWQMLQYSFVSFFYSGITPSSVGGQPMQFYYMCRDRISPSKATLVLFVTNMTYQIVILVLGLIMFFAKLKFILSVNSAIVILFFLGLSVNLAILLILIGVMFSENLLKRILNSIIVFLSKIKIIKKPEKARQSIESYLEEYKSGIALIKANGKRFFFILLSTIAHFVLYHMVPYFVYRAFGFSALSIFDFIAISSVMYIAVALFPLPGAVGAAESGFVVLFGPLFGSSILAAMLLSRFINFYTMMILSGAFSAYSHLRKPYNLIINDRNE